MTVALSGDGGDELFAGYERFAAGLAARRYALLPRPLRGVMGGALDLLPADALGGKVQRAQRFAGVAARGLPDAYRCWISFVGEDDRNALLDGSRDDWALEDYRAIWQQSEGAHPLDRLLDLNLRTYLLDDLLVKADRMSMAHGLEVRSPFLDADLIAYATRLPPRHKARGLSLKRVLKAAVADLLPKEILERGKRGFGVPLDRWFREDLRELCEGHARRGGRTREAAPRGGGGRPHARGALQPIAESRPRALDPPHSRSLPAARGLVAPKRPMERTLRSLYICYLSLEDPLVHSQVVAYLEGLSARGHTIHLLTFDTHIGEERRAQLREDLAGRGITWHSRRYHKRPSLPATVYDTLAGAITAMRIVRRYGLDAIHARNHVPAAMGLLAKRITGRRLIFDLRGLMAEEYVDAGHWREGGIPYRLTHAVQRAAIRRCAGMVMLTERGPAPPVRGLREERASRGDPLLRGPVRSRRRCARRSNTERARAR